jgi:hypothetical protein
MEAAREMLTLEMLNEFLAGKKRTYQMSCAKAYSFIRWLPTTTVRVRSCGIYGA